ncbi:MAG: CheR family methyltransferase [Planctomycetota bacterium]
MSFAISESAVLSEAEFNEISEFVKRNCGINLHDGKKELVKARLGKRIRQLGMGSFRQYMDSVRNDSSGAELTTMLDQISTNLTFFFREHKHFEHLRETVIPAIRAKGKRRIRIWSAGCSSGEEPYSIAMLLNEAINDLVGWDTAVLATDLSTKVLGMAQRGVYRQERFRETPKHLVSKYFSVVEKRPDGNVYQAKSSIRKLIHFARLNLMENWPMKGPFDVIFCRNVMIYFDKTTQGRLVNRYFDILAPGGVLFIGHSESLTGTQHRYKYVQPAIYQKP